MKKKFVFVALTFLFSVSFVHAQSAGDIPMKCTRFVLDGHDFTGYIKTVLWNNRPIMGEAQNVFYLYDISGGRTIIRLASMELNSDGTRTYNIVVMTWSDGTTSGSLYAISRETRDSMDFTVYDKSDYSKVCEVSIRAN